MAPGANHNGWYYNNNTGAITDVTQAGSTQVIAPWIGPFPTHADAAAYKKANPPSTLNNTPAGDAKNAIGAVTNINEFLSRLTAPDTWIRVAEVVLGVGLLFIVVKQTSAGQAVTSKVKSAASVAAIL